MESLPCIGSPGVRTIWIWGMGGIGKSTHVEALFNQISSQFIGKCFLWNVIEKLEKHTIVTLQDGIFPF